MTRIQQLPTSVITKIAAGEVIERPASVVKELLENAVDAGSTRIDVEVEQGGAELIRVVDNGSGIHPEDLQLAFSSHATSKLNSADDLFRIGTLGFRGEALASIGGVAQVTLQSRTADQAHGAEITCHGGVLSDLKAWNGASGTRLEVRHLFYNTPVRRKFLRTTTTEMGHIDEAFTRLALAKPDLHVTLTHHAKAVYALASSVGLRERIGTFFGAEVRERLYEIDERAGPARLRGFIADPVIERGNAKMQYVFLNGRWIRDRSVGHAIQEAYRGLLMTGRYAVVFLFLELPADQVDVNVHPTKAEVRFRDGQAVYHLVHHTIRERLRAEDLTARLRVPVSAALPEGDATRFVSPMNPRAWTLTAAGPATGALPFPERARAAEPQRAVILPRPHAANGNGTQQDSAGALGASDHAESPPDASALDDTVDEMAGAPLALPGVKAIQLYDSYLVLETPDGMLVIDQHALHERILFEQLKQRIRTGSLEVQRLLVPQPIDLPSEQAARALEQLEALAELGLQIEDFGGGTVLLTSYPAVLGNRPPETILRTVVDHLVTKERMPQREQLLNDLLSLMACHAAVKAGDRLTPEEISELIAQRDLAENTHHCPHGRPTALLLSRHDLDRQFRRI